MGFNEKTHAYIAAKFYAYLTEAFAGRGKAAFIHATERYAGQRGSRMAQRAIRDGAKLDHAAFMQYGELLDSGEVAPADGELISLAPDYEIRITSCPWYEQFLAMGMPDAGDVYCSHIDEALCRGFNPELVFQATSNLNTSAYCTHRVLNTNYAAFPDLPPKDEYKRGFDYHCAHSYWTYARIAGAIFGAEGDEISARVLRDVENDWGKAMADALMSYKDADFDLC